MFCEILQIKSEHSLTEIPCHHTFTHVERYRYRITHDSGQRCDAGRGDLSNAEEAEHSGSIHKAGNARCSPCCCSKGGWSFNLSSIRLAALCVFLCHSLPYYGLFRRQGMRERSGQRARTEGRVRTLLPCTFTSNRIHLS